MVLAAHHWSMTARFSQPYVDRAIYTVLWFFFAIDHPLDIQPASKQTSWFGGATLLTDDRARRWYTVARRWRSGGATAPDNGVCLRPDVDRCTWQRGDEWDRE